MANENPKAASRICHFEIPAPDLPKAARFYESVFGWRVAGTPEDAYRFVKAGDLEGALNAAATPSGDGVLLVLEVEDMERARDATVQNGGTLVSDRVKLPDAPGYGCTIADPNANRLGLWSRD